MQVTIEKDAEGVLGVPYGLTPERRFWNLESNPEFINQIPEVADYPELRNFLVAVAKPSVHFCTFGCEKWCKDVDYGNGLKYECGLCIDFAFKFIGLAQNKSNYINFANHVIAHGKNLAEHNPASNLALIKFEPKCAGLIEKDICFWIMTAWVFGAGTSLEIAKGARNYGLQELLTCMREISHQLDDIGASHGDKLLN